MTSINLRYILDSSTSPSPLRLAPLVILAEKLHRSTFTPSTATTQLRTLYLFCWRSWRRNYTPILTRRRPQHLAFAFQACLAGGPGGGTTSEKGQCTFCALSLFRVVPSFPLNNYHSIFISIFYKQNLLCFCFCLFLYLFSVFFGTFSIKTVSTVILSIQGFDNYML